MKIIDLLDSEENARFVSLLLDLIHLSILYRDQMSEEVYVAFDCVIHFIGEREIDC